MKKRLKFQVEFTRKSLTDKILTRIRSKRLHIEILRYAYRRRYFLPPRKSFQMYHQYFWKPKNCYVLVHFVDGFALGALISALLHFLCFYEILKALLYWGRRRGYRNGKVHEIIERETFVSTLLTFYFTAKLSLKKVCNYWVVSVPKVPEPNFWLLHHRFLITVYLLVFGFLTYSIHFIMHAIQQKA